MPPKIDRTTQKGWLSSVIRSDTDDMSKEDALQRFDQLARNYFNGGRLLPGKQKDTTRRLHSLVATYGPLFLNGHKKVPADDGPALSIQTLRSEARTWVTHTVNNIQEWAWDRLMCLINGLVDVKAIKERLKKARSAADMAKAKALSDAVARYKTLLDERLLFDGASGSDTDEFMMIAAKHKDIRLMDEGVRPVLRQLITTGAEALRLVKE
ncbi:hypothetical protein OC834_000376 [Tilletia horrida]|nr:hypothetical protein OC835_007725 [Tilletia horrida]KAK0538532.1 hypothetical protein OC834_000376 [Tilletia horrida]